MDDVGYYVVKTDSGWKAQVVGPAVRGFCGLVALALAGVSVWALFSSVGWGACLFVLAVATPFALLAAFGLKVPVADPAAAARFRELADPTRPLPASVLCSGPRAGEAPGQASASAPGGAGGTGREAESLPGEHT